MKIFKNSSMQKRFWIQFTLVIFIPMLLIVSVGMTSFWQSTIKDTKKNLEIITTNYVEGLRQEIYDGTLEFSHFLLVNDNQMINLISEYSKAKNTERYDLQKKVQELYNCQMISKVKLLGIQFFLKNGEPYCFKNYINISKSDLNKNQWYTEACEDSDYIKISIMDYSNFFASAKTNSDKVLLFTIVPEKYDKCNDIDAIIMCMKSTILSNIKNFDYEDYSIYVTDQNGETLISSDSKYNVELSDILKNQKSKHYMYYTSYVPKTNWNVTIVTKVSGINSEYLKIFGWIIIGLLLICVIFFFNSKNFFNLIVQPIIYLSKEMKYLDIKKARVEVNTKSPKEIQHIQTRFNNMIKQIQTLIENNKATEYARHKEELYALQLQINPHFLSNSLNTIQFMAQVAKYESIRKVTEALIHLVDCSFRNQEGMHSLIDELDMLNDYIYIMNIRYAESIEVNFDVDEECKKHQVPLLFLQPLIENSIIHGFQEANNQKIITIKIKMVDHYINILIEDNGIGMEDSVLERIKESNTTHNGRVGVSNVKKRLELFYGKNYEFHIQSKKMEYTRITIIIPTILEDE